MFDVYARMKNGERRVVFSRGFLIGIDYIDAGMQFEMFQSFQKSTKSKPVDPDITKVLRYAKYFTDVLLESERRQLLGQPNLC